MPEDGISPFVEIREQRHSHWSPPRIGPQGEPHALGHEPRSEVAKIPARDGENHRGGSVFELRVGPEIVEHLRDEAGDVDRIPRSERKRPGQLGIGQCLLGEFLAIIERPGNFDGGDIPSQRRELLFLRFTNTSGGIKDYHADAGEAEKPVRDGTPGVAGSGGDHGQFLPRDADKMRHQPRHESRPEVFEGERRPVKQFQNVKVSGERHQRRGKVQRLGGDGRENVFRHIVTQKQPPCFEGNLRERQSAEARKERRGQCGNRDGHVQSAVLGQPAHDGLAQ